jgi:leucyl/phenylalanyl-tRNA---protein transferase
MLLEPEIVLKGYKKGIFPMTESESGHIFWYDPDPRAIIPIDSYKTQKSLKPIINKSIFEIKINQNFEAVIRACAQPRFEGDGWWISEEFVETYTYLHEQGHAHSIEAYYEGKLAGGLYGVSIGSVFFGESMFFTVPNASKVAFDFLMKHLNSKSFMLLDTQFINPNVERFGAIEIGRKDFKNRLKIALKTPNSFLD